jgi:hypothetical protein
MDKRAEYDGRRFIGSTRRVGTSIKHAAWHPDGAYIGVFHSRSRARQILAVDAKLAANEEARHA